MKGVSNKVVREFKLAAKNPDKLSHAVGENPKRTILITALILLLINIGWFMFFGFTSAGNSRIILVSEQSFEYSPRWNGDGSSCHASLRR